MISPGRDLRFEVRSALGRIVGPCMVVGRLTLVAFMLVGARGLGSLEAQEIQAPVTVTENAAVDTVPFEGFHGITTCRATFGWVWRTDEPDVSILLDLFDGDELIATVVADQFREDLHRAGMGTGRYGFSYTFPDSVSAPTTVEVRIHDTDQRLSGSPRANPCFKQDVGGNAERGETDNGAEVEEPAKVMSANRIADAEVRVDGRLDEPVWARAEFRSDFRQRGIDGGHDRPRETMVAFAYDQDALYVAARMQSSHMASVDRRVDRRDEAANADRILISLDTFQDRRTAYTFGVTATGVRLDYYHPEDRESRRDDSFDPVWDARTVVAADGWTAEMRIPFSQLRYNPTTEVTWGLNIRRWSPQELANLYWVVVPMSEPGWASRFGQLVGLRDLGSPLRVEVAPYVLGGVTAPLGEESGVSRESVTRFGGNAKLGLGPHLTLDATINPDFGQVEADPAEVNLTAFETTFPERRPFFLEGSQLFQPRGPRYFTSRRVGSLPVESEPDYYEGLPDAAPIAGAAKLTGRLGGGTSIAALFARTSEALAGVINPNTDSLEPVPVSPATNFGVARVQQEFGAAGSSAGLIVTGVHRETPQGSRLASLLARTAVAGGADWMIRFAEGAYQLSGHAGGSYVAGDPESIARIQTSSAHYFQRPDAEGEVYDPSRTSLSGYTAGLRMEKVTGRHWTWTLASALESPGFEIRDAGTFRSADDLDLSGYLQYRQAKPGPVLHTYWMSFGTDASWNFEGIRQFTSASASINATFKSHRQTYLSLRYEAPALSDDMTRGGPLMATPAAWQVGTGWLAPFNATTQWSLSGNYRTDEFGGWGYNLDGGLSYRPDPRVGLSLDPGFFRAVHTRQFYGTWPDGRPETFGKRYVFASIDRREAYAQLRVDFAITPDLGVELYVEPFVSTGRYYDFGELAAPRTSDVHRYGEDGSRYTTYEDGSFFAEDDWGSVYIRFPDFTVKSMRSNAVLRWEWLRGSTFHLIWQQNRWATMGGAERLGAGALFDTFAPNGDNILTAKLTYRLGAR